MRSILVGGSVIGSVNIIKAKNSMGEYTNAFCRPENKFCPFIKLKIEVVRSEAMKKLQTKSNLFIFLTTSNPPIITNGIIYKLAIHQLADRLKARVIKTRDIAAGLKRCFLPTARIYFDAIASTETQLKNNKLSNEGLAGVIINAKISAVI
jgi:hypothetical protein